VRRYPGVDLSAGADVVSCGLDLDGAGTGGRYLVSRVSGRPQVRVPPALAITALATTSRRSWEWWLRTGVLDGRALRTDHEHLLADCAAGDRGRTVTGDVCAVHTAEVAALGQQVPDLGGGPAGAGQRLAGAAQEGE
jgi:hypothetical protein